MICVGCEFKPRGRVYTYHYDGKEDLKPGDVVKVPSRDGGSQKVTVVNVGGPKPRFETVGIIEKMPPPEPEPEPA